MSQNQFNAWAILSIIWMFVIMCLAFYPDIPIRGLGFDIAAIACLLNLIAVIIIGTQASEPDEEM